MDDLSDAGCLLGWLLLQAISEGLKTESGLNMTIERAPRAGANGVVPLTPTVHQLSSGRSLRPSVSLEGFGLDLFGKICAS